MASSAADNSKSSSSHHHSDDGPSDDDDGDPYGATAAKRGLHQTRDETAVRRVLGVVYDVRMQLHEDVVDSSHPEQPARISAIFDTLEAAGLLRGDRVQRIPARAAAGEDLLMVHTKEWLSTCHECDASGQLPPQMTGISESLKKSRGNAPVASLLGKCARVGGSSASIAKMVMMAQRFDSIYLNEVSASLHPLVLVRPLPAVSMCVCARARARMSRHVCLVKQKRGSQWQASMLTSACHLLISWGAFTPIFLPNSGPWRARGYRREQLLTLLAR
jgi:hypothetical protein